MLINILHMRFGRFRPDANKQCNIVVILQHPGGTTLRLRISNGACSPAILLLEIIISFISI